MMAGTCGHLGPVVDLMPSNDWPEHRADSPVLSR